MKAVWSGAVIAESERSVVVDGYHYFPPNSVRAGALEPSVHRTVCSWKGTASYFDVVVDGRRNPNAAWSYADPKPAAKQLEGWIGFWGGVTIEQ